jgi:hypothetical protein
MYESNGPDVKIRGNASHVAEKYLQLARDAQSSGDPIAAENYYQHAEHYFRMIAAAQEHLRQTQPSYYPQSQQGGNYADDSFDDGDGDGDQPSIGNEPYAPQQQPVYQREQQPQQREQQPQQREQQPQQQREQPQYQQPSQQQPHFQSRQQHVQPTYDDDVERLPSFITGGQPQQQSPQPTQDGNGSNGANGQNGQNGYDGGSPDRFPLHRRRRRHRGPRDQSMSGEGDASTPSGPAPADD